MPWSCKGIHIHRYNRAPWSIIDIFNYSSSVHYSLWSLDQLVNTCCLSNVYRPSVQIGLCDSVTLSPISATFTGYIWWIHTDEFVSLFTIAQSPWANGHAHKRFVKNLSVWRISRCYILRLTDIDGHVVAIPLRIKRPSYPAWSTTNSW